MYRKKAQGFRLKKHTKVHKQTTDNGISFKLQPHNEDPVAIMGSGFRASGAYQNTLVKDIMFVSSMFVSLGLGTQIPLLNAMFHGLGTQTQG